MTFDHTATHDQIVEPRTAGNDYVSSAASAAPGPSEPVGVAMPHRDPTRSGDANADVVKLFAITAIALVLVLVALATVKVVKA